MNWLWKSKCWDSSSGLAAEYSIPHTLQATAPKCFCPASYETKKTTDRSLYLNTSYKYVQEVLQHAVSLLYIILIKNSKSNKSLLAIHCRDAQTDAPKQQKDWERKLANSLTIMVWVPSFSASFSFLTSFCRQASERGVPPSCGFTALLWYKHTSRYFRSLSLQGKTCQTQEKLLTLDKVFPMSSRLSSLVLSCSLETDQHQWL